MQKLTETELELVRTIFRHATRDSRRMAECVYRHLFDIAPQVRPMFVTDMKAQGVKIVSTLGVIVAQLQDWETLAPMVDEMAMRHLAYGVKPVHYQYLGVAMHAMFSELLEDDFTPEAQQAWTRAYAIIADRMIDTAYPVEEIDY